jgi:hypothetical protein
MLYRRVSRAGIVLLWGLLAASPATAAEPKPAAAVQVLNVHACQANNRSPYLFVRAKFEPGEVPDPWAVRFFDEKGGEVPYFVWDSVTWEVARRGRADWGRRYALINHAPGCDSEVLAARDRKLHWAKHNLPELAERLQAREDAARRWGNSTCAALYLLRYAASAYAKERLTLRLYSTPQVEPKRQQWKGQQVDQRMSAQQGELRFQNLPDRMSVTWKGEALFRYAGFDAGGISDTVGHADPSRPFTVEAAEGIITKLSITSQTKGRQGTAMDWQCTYWLFPEGSYVALEGYSLGDTSGYLGGPQNLSIWQAAGDVTPSHEPLWEAPWWLHQVADRGFVATHLFYSTPLTIGYGNNPFTVNSNGPPRRVPAVEAAGSRLTLHWHHAIDDLAIARLLAPELFLRLGRAAPGQMETGRNWIDNNKQVVLAGKVIDRPPWMTPETQQFVEDQLRWVKWQPKIDWLYRQYAVGVGQQAESAEAALRGVIGAAAGWLDRPVDEEEMARLLVRSAQTLSPDAALKWSREMEVVPCLLNPDPAGLKKALARWPDQAAQTDHYIKLIETHVSLGGNPIEGRTGKEPGPRGEGWIVNPSYHATCLPYNVRFLDHFDLPYPKEEYHHAILRFADFSLELLGGKPLDIGRLRRSYLSHWPSRFVAIIPLTLAAYSIKPDQDYARAANEMFDVLMTMIDRNPQGYWSAWAADPKKAELFDTVYNGAGCQRGIPAFWADGMLEVIGRDRASQFAAAQARYLVFSAQLLDTLETDNVTAIYATKHGGHPAERKQIPFFLYDDFEFYRGLLGDLICWAAANPTRAGGHGDLAAGSAERELGLAESGCYLLRWALGIGPWPRKAGKSSASKSFEYRTDRLPDDQGFRLRIWNRLPWAQSTLGLTTQELGLPAPVGPKGPVHGSAVWLQLTQPAYRIPAEIEVARGPDKLLVTTTRPLRLRLYYAAVSPALAKQNAVALVRRTTDGSTQDVTEGVLFGSGFVDWHAAPGQYEIRPH